MPENKSKPFKIMPPNIFRLNLIADEYFRLNLIGAEYFYSGYGARSYYFRLNLNIFCSLWSVINKEGHLLGYLFGA
jgi:hypothetical protein